MDNLGIALLSVSTVLFLTPLLQVVSHFWFLLRVKSGAYRMYSKCSDRYA